MSWEGYISIIAVVTAVVFAVLWVAERKQASGETITLADAGEVIQSVNDLAPKIRDVAFEIVGGMQQLKETGKIATGDEAFALASEHLREWFPDIDPKLLTPFIENAYRVIKQHSARFPMAGIMPVAAKTDGQPWEDRIAEKLLGAPIGLPEPPARGIELRHRDDDAGPLLSREDELLEKWREEQEEGGFDPESDIPL